MGANGVAAPAVTVSLSPSKARGPRGPDRRGKEILGADPRYRQRCLFPAVNFHRLSCLCLFSRTGSRWIPVVHPSCWVKEQDPDSPRCAALPDNQLARCHRETSGHRGFDRRFVLASRVHRGQFSCLLRWRSVLDGATHRVVCEWRGSPMVCAPLLTSR